MESVTACTAGICSSCRASEHRGCGVLLYVWCEFNPIEVRLSSEFVEQVWCSIQIKNGQELLIGVCYRSPNAAITGPDNDQKLLCLLYTSDAADE